MPKTLRFELELADAQVDAIEVVKSLLMTNSDTGITNETTLEQMYCELSNVGLAILSKQMMSDDLYDRHREEVQLGNDVDDLLQ